MVGKLEVVIKMRKCRDCNHNCHCVEAEHVDEYCGLCECKKCRCKETD